MNRQLGIILAIVLSVPFTFAEDSTPVGKVTSSDHKTPTYLICKLNTAVRTLRLEKKKTGGWTTTYTKNGIDKIVSEGSYKEFSSKVMTNIRENLEKANWKCKDISEARVSSSE